MRKAVAMLVIAGLLTVLLVLWWLQPLQALNFVHIIITLVVLLMIMSFISEGIQKIRDVRKQLQLDDELSRKAEYRAGYYSYLISVFTWVMLYFLKDLFSQVEYVLVTGIFCMGAVFIMIRFIFRARGSL